MFIHHEGYNDQVSCFQYLLQSCRSKQKNNALHEMDFPTYNYMHINVLSQMKRVKNGAVWRALIIHLQIKVENT